MGTMLRSYIILCGVVVSTIATNVTEEIQPFDKTISQSIETGVELDGSVQEVVSLNETHIDYQRDVVIEATEEAQTDLGDVVMRGLREEKLARKMAIARMKQDMETVAARIRKSDQSELISEIEENRNMTENIATQVGAIKTRLNDTEYSVTQVNASLHMSVKAIRQNVTHSFEEMNEDVSALINQILETSVVELGRNLTISLQDMIDDSRAMIERMGTTVQMLEQKADVTSKIQLCMAEGGTLHRWNNTWYIVVHKFYSYYDADRTCQRCGAYLTDINSNSESVFIGSLVDSYSLWIGLNDRQREGTFTWAHNNERLSYSNWYEGQPDNDDYREDCVITGYSSAWRRTWNDVPCSDQFPFICKLPSN